MSTKIYFCVTLFLIVLSIKPCIAQIDDNPPPIDSITKDYKYEEVVQVKDNAIKSELYKRAKTALTTLFNSETNIIQSEDTAQGFIIAKVYSNMPPTGMGYIRDAKLLYTISIQLKNGKYRYSIDNLIYKFVRISTAYGTYGGGTSSSSDESPLINVKVGLYNNKVKREANTEIKKKITALKTAMETGSSGNLKKDW